MNEGGISEIVVTVCVDHEDFNYPKAKTEPERNEPPKGPETEIALPKLPGKNELKLLVLPCSRRKNEGGFKISTGINDHFSFDLTLRRLRQGAADTSVVTQPHLYMEAIDRYNGDLYKNLQPQIKFKITKNNLHVLYVSGMFGILRFDDHIPFYKKSIARKFWGLSIINAINKYCIAQNIPSHNVYMLLSPSTYGKAIGKYNSNWNDLWNTSSVRGTINKQILASFINAI